MRNKMAIRLTQRILVMLLLVFTTLALAQGEAVEKGKVKIPSWGSTQPPELPPTYINVAPNDMPISDSGLMSQSYGLLNPYLPIDIETRSDSFGDGPKYFMYRNKKPFYLREDESIHFSFLVGDISTVYLWPESFPNDGEWEIRVTQNVGRGRSKNLKSHELKSNYFRHMYVIPYTQVDVTITALRKSSLLQRRLYVTICPVLIQHNADETVAPKPSSIINH